METVRVQLDGRISLSCIPDSKFMLDEIWKEAVYDLPEFPGFAGMKVLDVGANQGFFSVYAAHRGATVTAYEPDATNYSILSANIQETGYQGRIMVHQAALAGRDGQIEIFKSNNPDICQSATITTSKGFLEGTRDAIFTSFSKAMVPAISLDNAVAEAGGRVDFLKMDCEGSEFEILQGAGKETLQAIRWVAMETHPGYRQEDLVRLLERSGFLILEYRKPSGPLRTGLIKAGRAAKKPLARMVAILEKTGSDRSVLIGADSFSIGIPEAPLKFEWSDAASGAFYSDSPTLPLGSIKERTGTVRLRVASAGYEDVEESAYSHFEPGSPEEESMPDSGTEKSILIGGPARFRIKNGQLPRTWAYSNIVIQVASPDSQRLEGMLECSAVHRRLEGWRMEVRIADHPADADLVFKIETPAQRVVKVAWWAEG